MESEIVDWVPAGSIRLVSGHGMASKGHGHRLEAKIVNFVDVQLHFLCEEAEKMCVFNTLSL